MADDGAPQQPEPEIQLPAELQRAIGRLPEPERIKIQVFISQVSSFRGPYPPPWMLDDYERHSPGFLVELLNRSKQAQDHAEEQDRKSVDCQIKYVNRAQIFGFIVCLASIGGAVACAIYGQWAVGTALGLTGLAPVVGHFMKNPFAPEQPKQPPAPPPAPEKLRRRPRKG